MRKVVVIALREYLAAVRTKSFLLSIVLMPLMMGGSVALQWLLKDQVDTREKHFAVVDRSPGGDLFAALERAVARRNAGEIFDRDTGRQTKPPFRITSVPPGKEAEQRLELSELVRKGDFFGFLEIGADVYDAAPESAEAGPAAPWKFVEDRLAVRYQSNRPIFDSFQRLAERVVNEEVVRHRVRGKPYSLGEVQTVVRPVPLLPKGLSKVNPETGEIEEPGDGARIAPLLVPGGLLALMFMMIMVGATPLMQGVVEEKMQRIAEVLLGSVRPFQLMMGKLLGMTGVSWTMAGVYLGGLFWAAQRYGFAEYIPAELLAWFVLFQTLAMLMYGSLFIAVGAACTDMKETQTLLLPVMLLATLPMFVLGQVVREPNSGVVTALSFFPPSTPMLMIARQGVPPGIPWWQPAVGACLVVLASVACVYAAGRIFRVGLLMQGKGARLGDLARWVFQG